MPLLKIILSITLLFSFPLFSFLPPAQANSEPIKVGILLPLSGIVADYGEALKNGFELAQSEIPEQERNTIEFLYEDTRYEAKASLSAFNKLVKNDRVDLTYIFGTNAGAILAPLSEQEKIPTIVLSGEPFVAGGRRYILDFHNRLEDIALSTLKYLRSTGHHKFGIVKTEVQYLESLVAALQSNLNAQESLVIVDSFQPDANPNLNATVMKVKRGLAKNEFDAIGAFLLPGQMSSFYQKMAHFKISPVTFGPDVLGQLEEMKKAVPTATGGFFATINASDTFSRKYFEKYKKTTHIHYAANSYDAAKLIYAELSNTTEKLKAEDILSKLENTKVKSGALGDFYFLNENLTTLKNPGKRFIFKIAIRKVLADGSTAEVK
jgi:ABC-type branched-subunit amino acid transport system substrate-binding protein